MATTKPLSTEAAAAHRNARFLRHRRAGLSQGGRKALTWEDAERALFERAQVLERLAEKVHAPNPCLRDGRVQVA